MTHVLDAQGRVKRGFSGGGLQYAEVYVKDNAAETAIGIAGTFVQFVGFAVNGVSNGAVPDHTQDHITISTLGDYLILGSFHVESIDAGAADLVALEIRKNNGTVIFNNLHAHRLLAGGGGDVGSMSVSGIVNLSPTDTVEVWVTNEDNATNILVQDANLSVVLL